VAVVVILLILFALWRGAYKMLFGLVSSLCAIILAIVLVGTVTQFIVQKTTIDDRIATAIDAPITSKIPNANAMISFYEIAGEQKLGYTVEGEVQPFSSLLKGSVLSILSKPIESIISDKLSDTQEVAFASILVATLVGYIMLAISFVILLIILSILIHILMALLKKFVQRTYLGNFVDKLLGAVLGIVLAGIIVYGALAIIKLLGTYEFIIPVNKLIDTSTITKFFFEKNFVYNWLVAHFNIKNIIDSIISKIGVA